MAVKPVPSEKLDEKQENISGMKFLWNLHSHNLKEKKTKEKTHNIKVITYSSFFGLINHTRIIAD